MGYLEAAVPAGSTAVVVAPVDVALLRAIKQLRATGPRDVDEDPIDHGAHAGAHAGHQQQVHAEPGRECDRAVHFPAPLAHRGDRRARGRSSP